MAPDLGATKIRFLLLGLSSSLIPEEGPLGRPRQNRQLFGAELQSLGMHPDCAQHPRQSSTVKG